MQYRLSSCILLHPICHKDKTGVVYSKRCNIALCLCILLHLICLKDKTGGVYKKVAISPMSLHMFTQNGRISPKSLHIAASDISQAQTRCCCI